MSTIDTIPEVEYSKIDGYSHFNYALLSCRGLDKLFDTMRYERAFLVRKSDVDTLLGEFEKYSADRFEVLVAAYSWSNKPHWTRPRLLSTMDLQELDVSEIFSLSSEFQQFKTSSKLRVRCDRTITGNLEYCLRTMYLNRAVPCTEYDAYKISNWRNNDTEKPQSIRFTNFDNSKKEWKIWL